MQILKSTHAAGLAAIFALALVTPQANAAPANAITPKVETGRVEIQRVCHHYRWSSRHHCTGAAALRFYAGPPRLHYPRQYYGTAYAPRFGIYPYYGFRPYAFGPYGFSPYAWRYRYYGY